MKRREFMRNLVTLSAGAAAATAGDFNPFRPRMRFAHAQGAPTNTLVVIFLRGGADGLNICVPHALDEYYQIRSSIAIPRPDPNNSGSAIDLDGFFGFHPRLNPLMEPWGDNALAVFPACHYPSASRSHFSGQQNLESGEDDQRTDGWLNRFLGLFPKQTQPPLRAIGLEGGLPHALRGSEIVSSFSNLANFTLGLPANEQADLLQSLQPVYAQDPDLNRLTRDVVARTGRVTLNDLGVLAPHIADNYMPENGADYTDTTFGRQMMQTAQMIKADVGLEVVTLSIGGWDTHSNQGAGQGRQGGRLAELGDNMRAFYRDMGGAAGGAPMERVVCLTMTEFGRTSSENGSDGTDHAHATTWMAMSSPSKINGGGGRIYPHQGGDAGVLYPGNPANGGLRDVRNRYLNHSVDFRDVMGEVMQTHLGAQDVGGIVGGNGYTFQPVGFLT